MIQQTKEKIKELYNITERGFLSIPVIPKDKYKYMIEIALNMSILIEEDLIEEAVISLPLIDLRNCEEEYIPILYSALCIIQAGWLWCKGEKNVKQFIPKNICIPLNQISERIGIVPILTYYSSCSSNWKLINKNGKFEMENLDIIFSMTNDKSERNFFVNMIEIENQGSGLINIAIDYAINSKLYSKNDIKNFLNIIKSTLIKIIKILQKIKSGETKCEPNFFYNVLRKFLVGWTNEKLFPNGGIMCETIGLKKYNGGSAAQSSLFPLIDIMISNNLDDNYLIEMRNYMPKKHANFLEWLKMQPNIKDKIIELKDKELIILYNDCIDYVIMFRTSHIKIVHEYISKQAIIQHNNGEEASALENEGSGGTNLKVNTEDSLGNYLKTIIEKTEKAKINL